MRLMAIFILALTLAIPAAAPAAEPAENATLYKTPECGCCEDYARYLRRNGIQVNVVATHDLPQLKKQHGVPEKIESCHTMLIGKYVVEGHVPVSALKKLLSERPKIKGISLPGMPEGSPGMGGQKRAPFTIYEIGGGDPEPRVYAVE